MMKHETFDPVSPDAVARGNEVVRSLIANELEMIREVLEQFGMQLCANMEVVQRYSEVLQGIDELAQRNENLARLLRAPAMEPAIDSISLENLRNRLLDGVADYVAQCPDDPIARAQGAWMPI